jgi:hypothetical protein
MSHGYTIQRISAPGEPFDPCAPLEFYPPKGSDELHEALKAAFPFEPTLQARMRQAVINFHLSEAPIDFINQDDYLPSPQSSFVSNVPSPSTSMPVQRRQSESTSRGASTFPAQEELMDVWSLPSKPHAKIHTRRNMTAEEKKAYKAKRLVGACADCKRRRRKCDHDASSHSPTQSSSRKVKQRKRSPVAEASKEYDATSTPFTAAPVAATHDFSFAPEDNFFAFSSGLDTSMPMASYDMSNAMSFDTSNTDLGFDLGSDFDLFPDLAASASMQTSDMDAADWLAGSPASLNIGTSAYGLSNWPTNYYSNAGTVPPTPQSMLMTPMSRTASADSLPESSTGSNMVMQNWPSASRVAHDDRSQVFQEGQHFFLQSLADLERGHLQSMSSTSSSAGQFTPESSSATSPVVPFAHGQEERVSRQSTQLSGTGPLDRSLRSRASLLVEAVPGLQWHSPIEAEADQSLIDKANFRTQSSRIGSDRGSGVDRFLRSSDTVGFADYVNVPDGLVGLSGEGRLEQKDSTAGHSSRSFNHRLGLQQTDSAIVSAHRLNSHKDVISTTDSKTTLSSSISPSRTSTSYGTHLTDCLGDSQRSSDGQPTAFASAELPEDDASKRSPRQQHVPSGSIEPLVSGLRNTADGQHLPSRRSPTGSSPASVVNMYATTVAHTRTQYSQATVVSSDLAKKASTTILATWPGDTSRDLQFQEHTWARNEQVERGILRVQALEHSPNYLHVSVDYIALGLLFFLVLCFAQLAFGRSSFANSTSIFGSGLSKGTARMFADVFQWALLLAAVVPGILLHSTGLDDIKILEFSHLTITSPRSASGNTKAIVEEGQLRALRRQEDRTQNRASSSQTISSLMQRTVSWFGSKVDSFKVASGRLC